MYCIHCNTANEAGDAFCENCGQKLDPARCQTCGQAMHHGDMFCDHCGSRAGSAPPSPLPLTPPPTFTHPVTTYAPPPLPTTTAPKMPLIFVVDTAVSVADHIGRLSSLPNAEVTTIYLDRQAIYTAPIREALETAEHSAGYKPWVILIASAAPVDDISGIAWEIQLLQRAEKLRFMALGVNHQSPSTLKQLTDVVFSQKGADFTDFFTWLGECVEVIATTPYGQKPQLPSLMGNVYRDK